MPHLHETGYGRKFYDRDLPALIDALERIATVLERLAPAAVAPDTPETVAEKARQARALVDAAIALGTVVTYPVTRPDGSVVKVTVPEKERDR